MTEIKLIRDDDKATKILAAVAQIDAGVELAPVVRCKDCKYAELFPYLNRMFCKCPDIHRFGLGSYEVSENHFCGYGERKEDAN